MILQAAADTVGNSGITLPQLIDLAVKVVIAIGGLGGVAAFFMVRAQKRKLLSETSKTDAEADNIVADAQGKRTDQRWINLLDTGDKMLKQMQDRLEDAEDRIDRLTEYVEVLVQALRTTGTPIPPMPKKMGDDARARSDFRDSSQ
jgi:hypothetical protein